MMSVEERKLEYIGSSKKDLAKMPCEVLIRVRLKVAIVHYQENFKSKKKNGK